jgi:hypothetical protein
MKLYVPEIGDHIRLTKEWTFTLYPEGRNVTLANLYGYRQFAHNLWLDLSKIEDEPERNYTLNYPSHDDFYKKQSLFGKRPSYDDYRKECKRIEEESTTYQAYLAAYKNWRERADKLAIENLEVTFPVGTVLAVDRIYIRKGSSDYSSITFYAKGLGESELKNRWSGRTTKWKAQRFWAKLQDCNNIEFELLDEKEVMSVFKVAKSKKS